MPLITSTLTEVFLELLKKESMVECSLRLMYGHVMWQEVWGNFRAFKKRNWWKSYTHFFWNFIRTCHVKLTWTLDSEVLFRAFKIGIWWKSIFILILITFLKNSYRESSKIFIAFNKGWKTYFVDRRFDEVI